MIRDGPAAPPAASSRLMATAGSVVMTTRSIALAHSGEEQKLLDGAPLRGAEAAGGSIPVHPADGVDQSAVDEHAIRAAVLGRQNLRQRPALRPDIEERMALVHY